MFSYIFCKELPCLQLIGTLFIASYVYQPDSLHTISCLCFGQSPTSLSPLLHWLLVCFVDSLLSLCLPVVTTKSLISNFPFLLWPPDDPSFLSLWFLYRSPNSHLPIFLLPPLADKSLISLPHPITPLLTARYPHPTPISLFFFPVLTSRPPPPSFFFTDCQTNPYLSFFPSCAGYQESPIISPFLLVLIARQPPSLCLKPVLILSNNTSFLSFPSMRESHLSLFLFLDTDHHTVLTVDCTICLLLLISNFFFWGG